MFGEQIFKKWQIILLISIFCLPFFINLGSNSLWDGNEGFYAEPAREVLESGNFLIPTYNYEPRFKKPPLATWIIAGSYYTFGVSEFAERFPMAIAAILIIWITYSLGKLIGDEPLGLSSALILATMLKFMVYSRQYAGDIFLTLFFSLSILYFARAMLEGTEKHYTYYKLIAYVSMGLGMLDKGVVAVVVPMTIIGLFILLVRRWDLVKVLFSPTGYLLTLVIGASWYTMMYWRYGWEFIQVNIINETVKRYVTDELGARAIYYYVGVYFSETLPWSIFIIPAIIYWIKWWQKISFSKDQLKAFLPLLTLVWFIFVFIFYSLAIGKRAVYLAGLYPAAAILIGHYFRFSLFNKDKLLKNAHIVLSLLLLLVCLASSIIILFAYQRLEVCSNLIYLSVIALILMAIGLAISLIKKRLELQLPVIITFTFLLILSITLVIPKIEFYRPIPRFAKIIESESSLSDEVGTFSIDTPSLMFYTKRAIFQSWKIDEMKNRLESDKIVYFVTREDYLEGLKQQTSSHLEVLDSRPLLQLRWEHLFGKEKKPAMHLVLVRKK
ncbi:MAG: dolichyl-phosphate-mannose-protein mannosyltransferase [bacterium]|nr:MAG: dolichyl-phosphate-mannose-protein mannosyltransferase [bacterium]